MTLFKSLKLIIFPIFSISFISYYKLVDKVIILSIIFLFYYSLYYFFTNSTEYKRQQNIQNNISFIDKNGIIHRELEKYPNTLITIYNKIFKLFKTKNECIICYSSGKNEKEELNDKFNGKTFDYPLIKLSDMYNCKCILYAHNICLKSVIRCPTCRIVRTKFYFKDNFILNFFNKNQWIIKYYDKLFNLILLLLICVIMFFDRLDYFWIVIMMYFLSSVLLNDYLKKNLLIFI
jgi:hypothetical protein